MIVAVDRQKLAWLLNENCSAFIVCVSFSSSSTTQDRFIWKYFSVMAETTRKKKKKNEKAAITSHKRASQTGKCGSVLVCNVNKGTLERKKKKTLEIISPSNTASCLLQWLHGELCGCWEQIFVAPTNKVIFCASYTDVQQERTCEQAQIIFKDVHYNSKILAEEWRYTVILIHVRVALICSCGKRTEAMANI